MKIDHLNIVTKDMDATVKFYTDLFPFKVTRDMVIEGEWYSQLTNIKDISARCVFIELPHSDCRIELLEFISPKHDSIDEAHLVYLKGIRHVAIEVDDIDSIANKAKSLGVELISNVATIPLSVQASGKKIAYLKAPDGVILELAQYGITEDH